MRIGLWLGLSAVVGVVSGMMACATGGNTTGSTYVPNTGGGGGGDGGHGGAGSTVSSSSTSSSSSSSTSSSGSTGGGGAGGGGSTPGLPLGSDCNQDADCESNLCKQVVINTPPVCVTPCTSQTDCGVSPNYFCEPITPGSPDGYCIPHSPAHCLSCTQDSDCGSLSEVCFQAPGDNANACHIDCSLSGADACPPDYNCTDQMVNGQARKLCRPKIIPTCLDAIGGFCDRLNIPQPCIRTNAAGMCLGERVCLPGTKRFDKCSAMAPQCKADCSLQDPAGCTLIYCAGATDGPDNCGSCSNVCPGYMQPNANVACQNANMCTFSCQGENFDVNNDASDGCEEQDDAPGHHTQGTASLFGGAGISCDDDPIIGQAMVTVNILNQEIVSDKRTHQTPSINGFVANSGSAPDWHLIHATGGLFCVNDVTLTLTMVGSQFPNCYKLSVLTDKGTYTCQTGANGKCGINPGGSSYSNNTDIYIKVEKTCDTTKIEQVSYTIVGHL